MEMQKTANDAFKLTESGRGFHHIGDFLPPEELSKFMAKVKMKLLSSSTDAAEKVSLFASCRCHHVVLFMLIFIAFYIDSKL